MNIKELAANLGLEEDEYRELIDLFAMTGTADFDKIRTAMDQGDSDGIMRSAHTIKGASANLGLEEVSETARYIELHAGDHPSDELRQAVQTLKTQIDAITSFAAG